jgi:hypothetical protein
MSPASKLKRATERSASFIARSTLPSSSPPGYQNSTAENPALFALPNRSRNGASLNGIETLAQNLINSTGLVINLSVQLYYLFL